MKKHEVIFSLVKAPVDFLVVFVVFFLARDIRLVTDLIPWVSLPIKEISNVELYPFALLWASVYVLISFFSGQYFNVLSASKIKEYLAVVKYSIYWFVLFSFLVYFSADYLYTKEIPRLVLIFTFVIWTFGVLVFRFWINLIQSKLLSTWKLTKSKILLVTNSKREDISYIIEDIEKAWIYELVGYYNSSKTDIGLGFISDMEDVKSLMQSWAIDEILFVNSSLEEEYLNSLIEYSKIYWIRYRYVTNGYDVTKNNIEVSLLNKVVLVEIKNTSLSYFSRVLKRLTDIVISFFALVCLFPVFIIIWILIKKEDWEWPILYKNRRVGQKGGEFNLYKFRYMKWEYCVKDSYWVDESKDDALAYEKELIEKSSTREGPLYKIKDDPRKTKIWAFIEKYSIDELPQFINVLLWDMSIVGPRPHQPREVELYSETQKRVLTIKPWITWMAQVNGRENNSFDDEVRFDIFYIENWSFLLDLKIFFKTFVVVFFRK